MIRNFSMYVIFLIFPLLLRIVLFTACLMYILHNQRYVVLLLSYAEKYSTCANYSWEITRKFTKSNERSICQARRASSVHVYSFYYRGVHKCTVSIIQRFASDCSRLQNEIGKHSRLLRCITEQLTHMENPCVLIFRKRD